MEEDDDAAAAAGGGCVVFRGCHLPPGFRFQPTDQEIIVYYLKKKIAATAASVTSIIADVDIYKLDPWDLPDKAMFGGEGEWFFFSPRDRKYPNGARPNRTAGSGYWKATGTDKPILASGGAHCLGVKKALVFYQGRSPKGTKTEWVMHEYRLLDTDAALAHNRPPNHSMRLDDWVLCRVRRKGGEGGGGGGGLLPLGVVVHDTTTNNNNSAAAAAAAAHSREVVVLPEPAAAARTTTAAFHHHFADYDGHGSMLPGPGGGPADGTTAPHHHTTSLVSVLESIKRNLSFQAIDELYLLQPPSKRANSFLLRSGAGDDDQHTSSTSFISETTDDFFF
ncbi:hypothetical protein BS78_03G001800 [Paspalum vaginatum]|nr:hypothetical protein BS78_03G001800 [Paspalum vaginatum]